MIPIHFETLKYLFNHKTIVTPKQRSHLSVCAILCAHICGDSQVSVWYQLAELWLRGSGYEAGGAARDLHWTSGSVKSHSQLCDDCWVGPHDYGI